MASPSPAPPRVAPPLKGVNRLARACSGRPGPWSATSITTDSPSRAAPMRTSPERPAFSIAWRALRARFTSTRCSWSGSAGAVSPSGAALTKRTPAPAGSAALRSGKTTSPTSSASARRTTVRITGAGSSVLPKSSVEAHSAAARSSERMILGPTRATRGSAEPSSRSASNCAVVNRLRRSWETLASPSPIAASRAFWRSAERSSVSRPASVFSASAISAMELSGRITRSGSSGSSAKRRMFSITRVIGRTRKRRSASQISRPVNSAITADIARIFSAYETMAACRRRSSSVASMASPPPLTGIPITRITRSPPSSSTRPAWRHWANAPSVRRS